MFIPVVKQSLREPREAAATLLSMGVPKPMLWPAFFLLIVLSVILTFLIGSPTWPNGEEIFTPFGLTLASAFTSVAWVFLIWKIGELMGGKGGFDEALLLTVFHQGMFLAGQLIAIALLLVIPPLANLFVLALSVFMIWLYLNFIAVLHGFGSLWRAFGVLVFAFIGVAFVLIFAMSLAGVRIAGVA